MSEVLISELDRERAGQQQGITLARSALARQLHVRPRDPAPDVARTAARDRPDEFERLYRLAITAADPSCRAAWPRSPATRRPSSWPASGSTPTSRSA